MSVSTFFFFMSRCWINEEKVVDRFDYCGVGLDSTGLVLL